jgi:hypothetical protein
VRCPELAGKEKPPCPLIHHPQTNWKDVSLNTSLSRSVSKDEAVKGLLFDKTYKYHILNLPLCVNCKTQP